jgi:hypothetical protein
MHAVIETPTFLSDVKAAGVSEDEHEHIINSISTAPLAGDLISGTGGARKRRIKGKGKGKRGAYRVITYYAGEDIPVFLLALVSKGQKANLSQAERNALKAELSTVAANYRAGVQAKVMEIRK